jgi:hypothetical protein
MTNISGTQCAVCDNAIILFSDETDSGLPSVITVDCYRCMKTHLIPYDDLVDDIPHFCCGRELLPNEYDEEHDDCRLYIDCAKCGAENEVSVDLALYALALDQIENHAGLQ